MKRETDEVLVMERPQPLISTAQASGTGIKTILFHVHDDDSVMDRLQVALTLARACSAHLHCLHVTPIQAYTIVDTFGGTFVSQDIIGAFEEQANKLRLAIEDRLRVEDVTWDYEEVTGELIPHLIQAAALADLVIASREPVEREFGPSGLSLIGDMLDRLRTPLLIIGTASEFDPFGPAVIAWNGSYEAANAVRASLPLLRLASQVQVVQFSDKKSGRFPSTALLEYLSRHGIKAELETAKTVDEVDQAIVRYALRKGAGLVVMGGYSHSRAGEFLFGGVTRALLRECPIALLMAR